MITNRTLRMILLATGTVTIGGLLQAASAQTIYSSAPVYYPAPTYIQAPPVAAAQAVNRFTDEQLDQLLGPIALYPDPLLAQILPASTYPMDVVLAQRWLQANTQPTEDAINAQNWDPSIKALVHYPTVLQMMNDKLEWTQALGAAFANQQTDVTESIQRLRVQAQSAGALATTQQQQVIADGNAICILPADPQVIYVPVYDPQVVYVIRPDRDRRPLIAFDIGLRIGRWLDNDFDWGHHYVAVGFDWRRDRRDDDRRDVRPINVPDRNVRVIQPETKAWTRNASKPAPVAPPTYSIRPSANEHRGYAAPAAAPRSIDTPRPMQTPRPETPRVIETPHPTPVRPDVRPEVTPRNIDVAPRAPEVLPVHPTSVTPRAPEVQPVHPAAAAPRGPTVFGDYENRVDVQRSVTRAEQSRPTIVAPAAPARISPNVVPTPAPTVSPDTPRDGGPRDAGPKGPGPDQRPDRTGGKH